MKKGKLIWIYSLIIGTLLIMQSCSQEVITLESLLEEMVDRDNIARFPSPQYVNRQFSSYDRGTTGVDEPGWFANSDRTMFIREEVNQGRKEHVMMDTEGPGSIVRIWMTFAGNNSGKGILRFYFDNDTVALIQGTAFSILSGGLWVGEPLGTSVSDLSPYEMRGHNFYLPLPYASHCKITYESENITIPGNKDNSGESVYYNINYRTYNADVSLETFSLEAFQKAETRIKETQELLRERDQGIDPSGLEKEEFSATLKPGETWGTSYTGSKAIRSVSLRMEAENLPQALRTSIIEAEFDGEKTIWCPAGDFFGTGYQIRHTNTWYTQINEDGPMKVLWVMPFKDECNISIQNTGDQDVKITGEILTGDWKWDKRSMHFGASWHQLTNVFTREGMTATDPGRKFDVNYVELSGKGVYVGDVLALFNTSYMWWGEGDEKIFIDGEEFPSHIGTGTEDYYGYAWGGRSKRFSNHPYIAQPDESGNASPGYVVNLRYRGLDAMPFNSHLKVDMELWHWHSTYMNYAPTSFYYLRPGGTTNIEPDVEGAHEKVALKSTDIISNLLTSDVMEAENMSHSNSCGNGRGSMAINPYGDVPLSNLLHVYWRDGSPGDKITFVFVSETEGNHDITGKFNTGPRFGQFRASLNGKTLGGRMDLQSEKPGSKSITLGKSIIHEGENILEFEVANSNRRSNVFALDNIEIN
jgi:hypothetical protein